MVDPNPLINQNSFTLTEPNNIKENNSNNNSIDVEHNNKEENDSKNSEQIIEEEVCPSETKWTVKCRFFGLNYVEIENTSLRFCNWWQCLPMMPIFVGILIIVMYIQFLFLLYPRCRTFSFKLSGIILISFFGFLFFICYFRTAFTDPGFLPFNWNLTRRFSYSWEEQLNGLAVTKSQVDYAKKHRPPSSSFSTFSGRFVIRADHICGWVSNWIGQRNHKFFFLMTFYGSIYAILLLLWQCFVKDSLDGWKNIANLVACAFQFLFGFFMFGMFVTSFNDLLHSRTQITSYKREETVNEGCFQAMEHVFGYGCKLCWFCPVSPFPNGLDQALNYSDIQSLPDN